ncbi:Mut7-C RNAse domain-containing protein [Candidatus Micrarchaeota archaeon]|nr:Mut7-C RNAse domain-containing protein [Candidatus Micrarchaeota archaeon]
MKTATKQARKEMKLLCDVMLGKLARWLRVLGKETIYFNEAEDDELLKKAVKAKAILITRDKRLAQKAKDFTKVVLLKSNSIQGQLKETLKALKIKPPKTIPQTLCPMCGTKLKKVAKSKVKNEVWPRVYKRQKAFWRCTGCRKLYWRGTHLKEIRRTIQRIKTAWLQ